MSLFSVPLCALIADVNYLCIFCMCLKVLHHTLVFSLQFIKLKYMHVAMGVCVWGNGKVYAIDLWLLENVFMCINNY